MKIEMDNDFRGNAYIIQKDEVLLNYSGGYADMANEIPNTIETRFASASMGKTFVAVGILMIMKPCGRISQITGYGITRICFRCL